MAVVLLIVGGLGCAPEAPTVFSPDEGAPGEPAPAVMLEFGIGDVDHGIRPRVTLNPESFGPSVRESQSETRFNEIANTTITVGQPRPERLLLDLVVDSNINWPEHAVWVEAEIFVDNQSIDTVSFVFTNPARVDDRTFTFDLLEHVTATQQRVVVHAECEFRLYMNTDPATIDPENPPEPDPANVTRKLSTPAMIQFGA